MQFFAYILQSQINDSFYKGSTNDLTRRLAEHNAGEELSTSRYAPWNLVWYAIKPNRSEAMKLELKLKNLSVERTIEFIRKHQVQPLIGGPDVAPLRQSGC
jgi:putative endonuclease